MELYLIDPLLKIIFEYTGDYSNWFFESGLLDGIVRNRKFEITDKCFEFDHECEKSEIENKYCFLPISPINELLDSKYAELIISYSNCSQIPVTRKKIKTEYLKIRLVKISSIHIIGYSYLSVMSYFLPNEYTPFEKVRELIITRNEQKPETNMTIRFLDWFPNIKVLKLDIENSKTIFISNVLAHKNLEFIYIGNPESRVFIDYKLFPGLKKIYIENTGLYSPNWF